jgi:hypothetical protein
VGVLIGALGSQLAAQIPAPSQPPSVAQALVPPLPASPVKTFRLLLTTNAAGRNALLAGKAQRPLIEAKLREYDQMTSEQREARLQGLELQWQMRTLMRTRPEDRSARLAEIPEPQRKVLQVRLVQWDLLPPPLQKEVLSNETAVRIFTPVLPPPFPTHLAVPRLSSSRQKLPESASQPWTGLSEERRQRLYVNFRQFIELDPKEKARTVEQFSDAEREQVQKTAGAFDALSKTQRERALEGFRKFAELSPEERQQFISGRGAMEIDETRKIGSFGGRSSNGSIK